MTFFRSREPGRHRRPEPPRPVRVRVSSYTGWSRMPAPLGPPLRRRPALIHPYQRTSR